MKRRIFAALLALAFAAGAASCGQNTNGGSTDASGAYENNAGGADTSGGADEYTVDMDAVDGDSLSSENDKTDYDGELGDVEVKIDEMKVIDYDGEKVAVVSFKYKNNGAADMPFTGSLKVDAYQNDSHLLPTVVTGVDGISMLSMSENVPHGEEITVQTAYRLNDTENPVTVEVTEFFIDKATSGGLTKTFEF